MGSNSEHHLSRIRPQQSNTQSLVVTGNKTKATDRLSPFRLIPPDSLSIWSATPNVNDETNKGGAAKASSHRHETPDPNRPFDNVLHGVSRTNLLLPEAQI